ncbi:MAG TPA: DUF87 domain-containing protein, partial [Acidimicrobiia bacterium]|nr:DUF87 domain-containing protein [Acidimicrobiia bacterium]
WPAFGAQGTWFYGGLAILLLSVALQEPFFTTPAHALVNGAALLLAAVTFPSSVASEAALPSTAIDAGRVAVSVYAGLLIVTGLTAVFTKDLQGRWSTISRLATRISGSVGTARVVYSLVYVLGIFAVFGKDPGVLGWLLAFWFGVVVVRPLERAAPYWVFLSRSTPTPFGVVRGVRSPGLVTVTADGPPAATGSWLAAGKETLLRVLDISQAGSGQWILASAVGPLPAVGDLVRVTDPPSDQDSAFISIGPVEPGSDIDRVRVRVPAEAPTVREGHLVRVPIRSQPTLFQIIGAVAKREAVDGELEHRYVELTASKIGAWDPGSRRFEQVPWLPAPGALVELVVPDAAEFDPALVGHIPNTSYGISADPSLLVTHNTAVLGILGVGKTYFVFELIRRIVAAGTKVVVLDITDQYRDEFREIFSEAYEQSTYDTIGAAIAPTAANVARGKQDGGNIHEFRSAIEDDLRSFLASPYLLKVYNPDRFVVTQQTINEFSGSAAFAPLTMVEVTRLISEALLSLLQSEGIATSAKVALVLEEAHSLVPEWNSTAYDGDRQASAGTAKAVLQGRKYGMGVILITQRTANVTKTILNQCHTVFALRSFDATGMEFLQNYVGQDYVRTLSTLADRTGVFFGRASSCPAPVILQVNDHDRMISDFWTNARLSVPRPPGYAQIPCLSEECLGLVDFDNDGEVDPQIATCDRCGTLHIECTQCEERMMYLDKGIQYCDQCGVGLEVTHDEHGNLVVWEIDPWS